jgi:hypothetical protein
MIEVEKGTMSSFHPHHSRVWSVVMLEWEEGQECGGEEG